ncbi:hypothetical protein [Occultella kanbiaonis]|uniref:hypothetical protein n=1 Tax=Occultella kanbiaonis TaxID=2675754 RepID=UPI0013D64044|nr:hypothetical protein [Occultella kanbiaonis]
MADNKILGIDRATGEELWTLPATGPRCSDDGARLTCVSGHGQDARILLVDPLAGAAGAVPMPGVAQALTDGDDLVILTQVAAEYRVSRLDGAVMALARMQGSGPGVSSTGGPTASVPDWAADPTWLTSLEPGVSDWPPTIALFGTEVMVSVPREADGPSGSAIANLEGHILDVATGDLIEDTSRAEPGGLESGWLVERAQGGLALYSPGRGPVSLGQGQQFLQVDDDPASPIAIRTVESAPVPDGQGNAPPVSEMVATSSETGEVLWSRPDEWAVARLDGHVLTTTGTSLVGVDETSGAERWTLGRENGIWCPCVGGGHVLAGFAMNFERPDAEQAGPAPTLVGIDVRTGDLVWWLPSDGWWVQVVLDGDRMYAITQADQSSISAWDVG